MDVNQHIWARRIGRIWPVIILFGAPLSAILACVLFMYGLWGYALFSGLVFMTLISIAGFDGNPALPRPDDGIASKRGKVVVALEPEGTIRVGSEFWNARTRNGSSLPVGSEVVILSTEGLACVVEPTEN